MSTITTLATDLTWSVILSTSVLMILLMSPYVTTLYRWIVRHRPPRKVMFPVFFSRRHDTTPSRPRGKHARGQALYEVQPHHDYGDAPTLIHGTTPFPAITADMAPPPYTPPRAAQLTSHALPPPPATPNVIPLHDVRLTGAEAHDPPTSPQPVTSDATMTVIGHPPSPPTTLPVHHTCTCGDFTAEVRRHVPDPDDPSHHEIYISMTTQGHHYSGWIPVTSREEDE